MHPDMSGNKKQATPVTLSVDPFNVFNENETPISINQKMIEASKAAEGTPFAAKKTEPVAETVTPSPQPYKKPEKQDLPGMKKVKELTKRTKDDDSFPIGILISDQQWQLISSEAAKTTNPEETIHKYAAAITYAREYGMEIPVAMQNLEQLNQYQLGEPYQATRTNTQAIANSFKVSALSSDRMDLTAAFRKGDLSGKDISQLDLQIQDVERQLESLKDNVPRNWFVEWLKLGGENSVYGLEVAGHGLAVGAGTALALSAIAAASGLTFATGGLGAPVASSVIPIAMGTIVGAGTTAATAKRAFEMEQGVLYYELRKQGISKDVANYMSSTSGMITGVTEALFNQIGSAAMRQMGKVGFVGQATSKIMGRLAISGKIGVVAKGLMDYTLDAAGEFPQEWVQSVSNSLASDAAFALSDMVPPEKSIPMFQQAFEEGLQGFAVGLLMGTGTASANIAFDVQGASQLNKTAASIPSKEAFIASTKEQKPESVTKEDWDTSMDKVWTRQWADRKESTAIQSEEAAINELDSGKGQAPSGRIRRLSSGELFIQESETVTTDTQGNEHHQLFVGDPVTSQRYGYIDYTIRDNALTIEDIKIRSGYEGIRKESLLSLLKQYPGFDVAWEAKGENLEALKQEIISTNPRGPAAGLQVYDGVTNVDERLKLEKIIGESFPNLNASERSVASTLLQLRAEAKGMTTDSYMQSVSKDGVLYARGTAAELGNERAKGAVAFDTDAMAIIHAAEKADFSTFVHETFHVIRREMDQTEQLKQAMMEAATTPLFEKFIEERRSIFKGSMFDGKTAKEIAEYAKSFEETWTRQQEELAAKLWESYLTDGQASNKKLSGIFRRIAEWLGKIYSDVKRRTKLDPRIAGVFDSLLDKNSPLAKSVRAAEQKNSSVKTEPGKYRIVSLFQEAPAQGTKEYAELVKGTHSLLKDGENTLKVLYHGTDQSFSDFDPSMIGENYIESGNGFYFVDDIRTAERYAKLHAARAGNSNGYVMPVNLVMQDPHIQNSPSSIDAIEYFDDHSDEIISEAKIKGNDGVIIKGTWRNLYVAFSSKQIYSASETSLLLFQEEGNPKIETDYPRRPEIDFKTYDIEKSIEQMDKWKADLKKWAASQGDMLQFGDEELVHVIHKNVIPDEKPWRSTSFIFFKEEWIPSGHSAYDTKFEALLDNVDSKNYRPDILFQEEGKTLAVLHNVSSERLIDIEALGGMPSPSIAVTRQDIDFTQFGDTTLIMDPSVAERAMAEGRLYNRDVWSPTMPDAEWKVNKQILQDFDKKLMVKKADINGTYNGIESLYKSDYMNGAKAFVNKLSKTPEAMALYLDEHDIPYKKNYTIPQVGGGVRQYLVENIRLLTNEWGESFNRFIITEQQLQELKSIVRLTVENKENGTSVQVDRMKEKQANLFNHPTTQDRVFEYIEKYEEDSTIPDFYETKDRLKEALIGHEEDFKKWLHSNVKEAYSYPSIKIRGKNFAYDAKSSLDWMRTQNSVGVQSTITYGPKLAGTYASEQMRDRTDMSDAEASLVPSEESKAYYIESIDPLVDYLNREMPEYYQYSNSWESLDSIYKAIARYLKGGHKKESTARMRTALNRESFSNVPGHLVSTAVELAHNLANQPQDYFEAKPDRVVTLNEVRAAIIPISASSQAKEVLARNNIEAVEYTEASQRSDLVRQYIEENKSSLLFQEFSEISEEQIMEDAKTFDSWEEFQAFYLAFADPDDTTTPQDEQWYREVWSEANKISTETTPENDPQTLRTKLETEEQKDEYFRSKMMTDEGIDKFIDKIGWIYTNKDYEHQSPQSQEEVDFVNLMYELRLNLPSEMHPTINANALRRSTGKKLTGRAIKSIRTLVTGDAVRYYRDVYADVMEDPELKAKVIDERLPKINEPGFEELENMSIMDRVRLSQDIEGEELKKKILSGKETLEGDAEKVIRVMDRKIAELQKQIDKAETEIEQGKTKLTETEQWRLHYSTELSEAQRQLNAELKAIRKLTNEDRHVSDEQMKNAVRLKSKVELLHDQVMKNRASERVNATIKRQEALGVLKDTLREKQKERDDARKVREYKLKLSRQIMVKPSESIDLEYKKKIIQLQATLDPKFRQTSVAIEGERVTIEEAKQILDGTSDEEIREILGDRLYQRITDQRKPLNDWTIAELEEVAQQVSYFRLIGRRILDAKNEQKRIIAENYQQAIIGTLLATGKYVPRPLTGSSEDLQQKRSAKNRYRAMLYSSWPYRVKAMMLDNHQAGSATDLLVTQYRKLRNLEYEAIENRQKAVFDAMEEAGITQNDLYEVVSITLDGKLSHVTKSYLAYAWLSQFSKDNRDAVAYGSLLSKQEKNDLYQDNNMIRDLGNRKYNQLIKQAKYFLFDQDEDNKMLAVIEAIRDDLNSNAGRVNEIAIREYNQEMRSVDNYLPMHRRDLTGDDLATNVADDLYNMNAGGVATSVEGGFRINRINISPLHQSPIEMDLIRVWDTSLKQHEHFIAFAEYGRKLNRVFKNLGSQELRGIVTQTYGKALLDDIDDHINEVMNPQAFNRARGADKMMKAMRGNLGAAYLAWKMSGMVLQAITSPMPFLSDVSPIELVRGYIDISIHPFKTWEIVSGKSQMMKNRTPNPIIELILKQSQDYGDSKMRKFNIKQQEIGSMGLTLVDRWAVAGGWLAAYRQKLGQLTQTMDSAEAEIQAVKYADEVVLRTQPQGDSVELSPLFKMGGEAARAVTQFQTALNVIWTNVTYDVPHMFKDSADKRLPDAVRKTQFKRAVGQITGYVLAGAILGAVQEGHDDDDDALKKLKDWIYWSFTQFTGSVPLIGGAMDEVARSIVTGDKPRYYSTDLFPAASNILDSLVGTSQAINNLLDGETDKAQGNYKKALKNLAEGFGYFSGAPVSGTKQLVRTFKQGPGALLGR